MMGFFFPLIYWKCEQFSLALTYFVSALLRVCSEQGFLALYSVDFASCLTCVFFCLLKVEAWVKSSHNISDTGNTLNSFLVSQG